MTQEPLGAQPLGTPAPPLGYWYARLNFADQGKASKAGSQRVAEEFAAQVQTGVETYAHYITDPEKLKQGYRRKEVALWVGQRVYFPRMFEAAWAKWERVDPEPEGRRLRDALLAEISAQAEALERQIALQEALARNPPPPPIEAVPGGAQQQPGAQPAESSAPPPAASATPPGPPALSV